jgi:hypothetical protein
VDWTIKTVPMQGTTSAGSRLVFSYQGAGGGYTSLMQVQSSYSSQAAIYIGTDVVAGGTFSGSQAGVLIGPGGGGINGTSAVQAIRLQTGTALNTTNIKLLGDTPVLLLSGSTPISWDTTTTTNLGGNTAVSTIALYGESTGVLAQRSTTQAQAFLLYNTFTTVLTAGEWWKMDWQTTANQFRMGAVKGSSSGTARVATWDYGDALAAATAAITVPASSGNITFGGGLTIPGGTLITTNTALTDGAAAQAGTLLNAPAAGNPTKWIPINDNGTTRYIPAW